MSDLIIRAAVQADLPILKEFEQDIIATERPFNDSLKSEYICYYDIGALIDSENSSVLVAEDDGMIVGSGYARIRESKAHLTHDFHVYLGFMFVAPTHRGRGINQLVIQSLISWGKSQGMQDFYLEAYAQNNSALRAYEKLGFKASLLEMKLS
ncbi:GNAT family N-acetyltransferase [uncultured Paraglaciecola sp.]|jgi:GNAT superfamily N-acetyltransferase|uniref:GNAT family N-acetyltransferase n=1 Tax=uncultured Paraglaciecola sp. TaxID=1765024 RepID=UPI00260797AA|nr:GNAT family N-acetyltransferase [uncultured Paraglaciecola sp.]